MISTGACCADFENVLQEFVGAGADVNARDDHGRTPLHRVGLSSAPNIVTSALLDAGADPGARDLAGSTALHNAASRGRGRQVPLLVAAGADIDARDNRGRTPLHVARDLGHDSHSPAAREPIRRHPGQCRDRGRSGGLRAPGGVRRFFAFATPDIIAGCIAGGTDGHTIADGSQATALIFTAAASTPDPAVVSMLLEAGADVHARSRADGHAHFGFLQYTPLHYAAQSGTPQVVRALLEAGADVDAWAKGFGVDCGVGLDPAAPGRQIEPGSRSREGPGGGWRGRPCPWRGKLLPWQYPAPLRGRQCESRCCGRPAECRCGRPRPLGYRPDLKG